MSRFKKRPIAIEAIQFNGGNVEELQEFTKEQFRLVEPGTSEDPTIIAEVFDVGHFTWVGVHLLDWIIRGTEGEFYPHLPVPFEKNYEPA